MVGREKRGGKNHKEDRSRKASRRNEWGGGGGAGGRPGHDVRVPQAALSPRLALNAPVSLISSEVI